MNRLKEYEKYAPVIVRAGIAAVFLWFGINQIFLPEDFMGYLPNFLLSLDYAHIIVIANGVVELILGGLLLFGYLIRPVSVILFLHLISIIVTLGYNDIAVRDAGLALVTLALALGGKKQWTLKQ